VDPVAWRARAYFVLKLPLAALGLAVAAACWLGGLYFLTLPVWRALASAVLPSVSLAGSFLLIPLGAALLLAAPWLLRGTTEPDRWLIRTLLGASSPAERIRALQESRARVVDDSASRLRGWAWPKRSCMTPHPSIWPVSPSWSTTPTAGSSRRSPSCAPWPAASTPRCWTTGSRMR